MNKTPRRIATAAAVATIMATSGCGAASKAENTVFPAGPAPLLTAQAVAQAFKDKGLPVANIQNIDINQDPDHLLDKAMGYQSKASFTDTRIHTGETGVAAGGIVEWFAEYNWAVQRERDLEAAHKKNPKVPAEHDFLEGAILIRISDHLTDAQAKAYYDSIHTG